jgi:hypothetical protein
MSADKSLESDIMDFAVFAKALAALQQSETQREQWPYRVIVAPQITADALNTLAQLSNEELETLAWIGEQGHVKKRDLPPLALSNIEKWDGLSVARPADRRERRVALTLWGDFVLGVAAAYGRIKAGA